MRFLVRFLFLAIAVALVFPFLVASLLVDEKGVPVQGQVVHKDEWISVGYTSWTRHADVTLMYQPPDGYGAAFLNASPDEQQFDGVRKGDSVELHYLLAKDLPDWPGIKTMRQMHLLPMARLATQHTWSWLSADVGQARSILMALAIAAIIVLAWRVMRLPFFAGVMALALFTAIGWSIVASFPKPTPAPARDVKNASGTVKSVEYWTQLFESNQNRDSIGWIAAQPIAVVGVQFVPEGRSEPVVAVDLIDKGSVRGLAEHAQVSVDYESKTPRVAHVRGAQRQFAQRNFRGLLEQGAAMALVAVVLCGGVYLFGRFVRTLGRAKA